MNHLRAGVASVNITPPIGLELSGYGFGKSRGILDDLYAQALILDNGDEKVVIITTDLIGLNRQYVNEVRAAVEDRIGVSRDHVLICGSHTHSGPATMYLRKWGEIDMDYVRCCEKKLIGAAVWASTGLAPAEVGFGRGFVDSISYNRIWNGGPIDPEVGVMRIDRENGGMRAILMNFSCHPVNLHSYGNLISADFPGYARRLIEKAKGGVSVLYSNGAGGDINPVGDTGSIAYAERNGVILGCESLKVAEQIKTTPKAELWAKTKNVKLPLGQLPSKRFLEKTRQRRIGELKRVMRNRRSYQDDMRYNIDVQNAKLDIEWAEYALREVEKGQLEKFAFVELQAIGINDQVLIGIPGEVFVDIGLRIKRNYRHGRTSIIGYANGCEGYIPTREAYELRAYETAIRKVYGIYPFKPDVGEIIIDAAKELINSRRIP